MNVLLIQARKPKVFLNATTWKNAPDRCLIKVGFIGDFLKDNIREGG